MHFCETCRAKKNWPESVIRQQHRCEQCNKTQDCHDVPSVMLVPEKDRTIEQKLILDIVQQGFKDKAEAVVIARLDGNIDNRLTEMLRTVFVKRGSEIDWFATFAVRIKLQEGHQTSERAKRDRRLI